MKAYDFEFDGVRLSDKNFMLCKFDSNGIETIQNGAEITFNTISTSNGLMRQLTSSTFDDGLTFTLQICKNPCDGILNEEMSVEDMRGIMRWLNRNEFHEFRLIDIDGEFSGIYFEAGFNVSRIELDGRVVGFELNGFTNRPFAFGNKDEIMIDNEEPNVVKSFFSRSDQEGHVYPDDMTITVKEDGDLEIYSVTENRKTVIKNCVAGESITMNYPMISSSSPSHNKTIANDFNWIFYRIVSSFKNRENEIKVSLPCSIKITYSPVIKIGI